MGKKAIILVSFGTTDLNIRKVTIDKIEERVKIAFPEYEIKRAFTSEKIINKLKLKYNIEENLLHEQLIKLKEEEFSEVIVQSLHIIPGEEFDKVKSVVDSFELDFKNIQIGRPLLYYKNIVGELFNDFDVLIDAVKSEIDSEKINIIIGHGSNHPADSYYTSLQVVFDKRGYHNVIVTTLEGNLKVIETLEKVELIGTNQVKIISLFLSAGHHLAKDIFGESENSIESILKHKGFEVEIYKNPLGTNLMIQDIFINHIFDSVNKKTS